MKDHNDYSVMIQLLIDHELPEGDRVDLLTHIADCASCLQQLEEAESFSEMVRQARPRTEAPAALRERVVNLMANPENSISKELATSGPITQKRFAVRSLRWPVAAAAMVAIAVSGLLFISHLRRESRASTFINMAIAEHREPGDGGPLEVRSGSPEIVAAWFARRVSFPFRIPNAGIAADDRAKYSLIGGRLVKFGGESAALLKFQMPGNRISLLISSNKLVNAAGGKAIHSDGLSFHAKDMKELHVATWDNKGLSYALVSSIPMGGNSSCSNCHKDSSSLSANLRCSQTSALSNERNDIAPMRRQLEANMLLIDLPKL